MLESEFESFFDTPQNRLNLELSGQGFRVIWKKSICNGCKLAHSHLEYPSWYKCIDSVNNPRGEWPAVFEGEMPVACVRKEE